MLGINEDENIKHKQTSKAGCGFPSASSPYSVLAIFGD
jgi:hypothetical protein